LVGDRLANFEQGFIYPVQGLPTEEYTEDLIIPEVMGNYVHEYVEAELKKKVFEFLYGVMGTTKTYRTN
jgi:hypothetical protein